MNCVDCEVINEEVKIVRGVVYTRCGLISYEKNGARFHIPACCGLCLLGREKKRA